MKKSSEKQLKIDVKYLKKVLDNNKDEIEWLHTLREKVDNIMQLQAKYDMECG